MNARPISTKSEYVASRPHDRQLPPIRRVARAMDTGIPVSRSTVARRQGDAVGRWTLHDCHHASPIRAKTGRLALAKPVSRVRSIECDHHAIHGIHGIPLFIELPGLHR
jgi:hypothetical protein